MLSAALKLRQNKNTDPYKTVTSHIRPITSKQDAFAVYLVDREVYEDMTEEQRRFIGGPKNYSYFEKSLDNQDVIIFGAFDDDGNAYGVSAINFDVEKALISAETVQDHFKTSSALLEGTRVLPEARGNSLQKKFTEARLDIVSDKGSKYALTQVVRDNIFSMVNMCEAGFSVVCGTAHEDHGLIMTFAKPMIGEFNFNGRRRHVPQSELTPELIDGLTSKGLVCTGLGAAPDNVVNDNNEPHFVFQSLQSDEIKAAL
jgi:hypothetical protein